MTHAEKPYRHVDRIAELEGQLAAAQEHIKKLARRIHNQRVALRENWEIIEMRASYPRRRALMPRMLACALAYNRRVKELERQIAGDPPR